MGLALILGVPRPFAVDIMMFLWFWAQRNNRGSVPDNPAMLSEITRWAGDGKKLRDALIICKWLDVPTEENVTVTSLSRHMTAHDEHGILMVHNWQDYAGKLTARRESSRKSSQKYRELHKSEAKTDTNPVSITSASRQHDVTVTSAYNSNRTEQNRNTIKEISKDIKKKQYGQFKNVLLTDGEHEKLKAKFNSSLPEKIEKLSEGIAGKGYKYKSHYATILSWSRKDENDGGQNGSNRLNPQRSTKLPERHSYTEPPPDPGLEADVAAAYGNSNTA